MHLCFSTPKNCCGCPLVVSDGPVYTTLCSEVCIEGVSLKLKAFWSRRNACQAPNEKENMAADGALPFTPHCWPSRARREVEVREQRGAHFPSPPGSIFSVPPALSAQLPAGSGCTNSAAAPGWKNQGIFQVAFKYPQDHEVFEFFYKKDLIPFWTYDSLENHASGGKSWFHVFPYHSAIAAESNH